MRRLHQLAVLAVLGVLACSCTAQQGAYGSGTGSTATSSPKPAAKATKARGEATKPPEAWRLGNAIQRQMYADMMEKYLAENPAGTRPDPMSETPTRQPYGGPSDDPRNTPPPKPPRLSDEQERLPSVMQVKKDRDFAYELFLRAMRNRDEAEAKRARDVIVEMDQYLIELRRRGSPR
jgi:hypothetical protein